MCDMLKICIPGLIGGIIGGCIGPFLQHKFTQRRDREARKSSDIITRETRKRDFLSFLHQWCTEISLAPHGPTSFTTDPPAVTAYRIKLPLLHSQIEYVQIGRAHV